MAADRNAAKMLLFLFAVCLSTVTCQILVPPYFNLAENRDITATATCGEGEGITEPELFCKLTGANPERGDRTQNLIQGQLCDFCEPNSHPASQAIDGSQKWWQSPPLSRSMDYNKVNLTIELGQEFHVAYVFIKMANSPRPGVFALERSTDHGKTWKAWQYFADTPSDCINFFDTPASNDITADDSILCTTDYSKVVPLEGGEIVVSLVNGRPSASNFSYATDLQEFTRATTVRLRLLRTKTLLGHLMAVARQDPTVTRRYYYSIKDISIGGRCVCNGHADVCDKTDPDNLNRLLCRCQHNTCGPQCERCCPGFVAKKWKPATVDNINACEPCQCYGHTLECVYDEDVAEKGQSIDIHGNYEGGGVCQNCQDNTEGINCEKCKFGYFHPRGVPLNATNTCQRCNCDLDFSTGDCEDITGKCFCRKEFDGPNCERCSIGYYDYPICRPCDCHINGTRGQECEVGGGQCPCKYNYAGRNCDQCGYGFFGFPECKPCQCDRQGSITGICDAQTGQCSCKNNYGGRNCSECADGYHSYPSCQFCDCDRIGTQDDICRKSDGRCLCKENYSGERCDRCAAGYYNYPNCVECGCEEPGSQRTVCYQDGQCLCKPGYTGRTCNLCAAGYYKYPECLPCECDQHGSYGTTCDQETGQCSCRPTFQGVTCNKCKENFYNYPICEECNCNPAGAKEVEGYPLGGCGALESGRLCECKDRVEGRICDECKPRYWNLNINNVYGCDECDCFSPGTVSGNGVCDTKSGQCMCKAYTQDRRCNKCSPGTYRLRDSNLFGCEDCGCTVGGSLSNTCDQETGQCVCRSKVTGRTCDRTIENHFVPTLYQLQFEMEDGRTPSNSKVRFGFDENIFPGFSWRGYASYSPVQDEVLIDFDIHKPSLYRVIFRYVNPNSEAIKADITMTPESATESIQSSTVMFKPTKEPQFVTVSGNSVLTTFVLNPGKWTMSLKTEANMYVDYMVLLPQSYYEAPILQDPVRKPCLVQDPEYPCVHYTYVDAPKFSVSYGYNAFVEINGTRQRTQLFEDQDILTKLGTRNMGVLDYRQPEIGLNVVVDKPGSYILVIKYHSTDTERSQHLEATVRAPTATYEGEVHLPGCPYSTLCRQVITDINGQPGVFFIDGKYALLSLKGNRDISVAIDSVIAVPVEEWDYEYVRPRLHCIKMNGECVDTGYNIPVDSIKVDFEVGSNVDHVVPTPPHITDTSIKVIGLGGELPVVNVTATVAREGPHIFIVHYYQPNNVGIDIDVHVDVNGQREKGKIHLHYCPSVGGCRSVIEFESSGEHGAIDLKGTELNIFFNSSSELQAFLDYVLVVPAPQFTPTVLEVLGIDRSGDFIRECSDKDFYIDGASPDFCKRSVFKLTTDYNNGALDCGCNIDGSLRFKCNEFGGQCHCRANVIGRTCSRCRTGFWGFPNCRPCECPGGLCHALTGGCVCPPKVTGHRCDVCLPNTYGFDPLIGCEDCNCDPDGVVDGKMSCDINTGQCQCKPNIGGRRCDRCLAGHYRFPFCRECRCDPRGSTAEICDQLTAECLCKDNVEGENCDTCKANTFHLSAENPLGCTKCFCFGTTSRCESSDWRREEMKDMAGWAIGNIKFPDVQRSGDALELQITDDDIINDEDPIYWIAPLSYLENKVAAYGGKLMYNIRFTIPTEGESYGNVHPDVRLEGNNITIVHTLGQQPSPGDSMDVEVELVEHNFINELTRESVTREQFMMVLARIHALQIRASYYDRISSTRLEGVKMTLASENGTGEVAHNVEKCTCPSNYRGPSCEECAPGFYRSRTGPYLGVCVPCQCNNKADFCDPNTGDCKNCRDNYSGPQCVTCKPGFYEDKDAGVCKLCSCPLPTPENNFADSCEVGLGGITLRCDCYPGYAGPRCDACEPGYYGNPTAKGGSCQRCQCSNNIDMTDRTSCDPLTGECLRCLNNSTGDQCERCIEWFYGDAVEAKNCRECKCNRTGTERCDYRNGACLCKPNVVGPLCDRCRDGTFGFADGDGCKDCDCAPASYSPQCNPVSGQCQCKPGVTGRRCDVCEDGYWNYGSEGCTKCKCEFEGAVTCDPRNGRCMCQPGVTGDKCDRCLPRFIQIPGKGCRECDSCVHLLLDEVEILNYNVTEIRKELLRIHVGVDAIRRLENINKTAIDLRPKVDDLLKGTGGGDLGLDKVQESITEVQSEVSGVEIRIDQVTNRANKTNEDVQNLLDLHKEFQMTMNITITVVNEAVKFTKTVRDNILNSTKTGNLDRLLEEAEAILVELQERDFTSSSTRSDEENRQAIELLERVRGMMKQVNDLETRITNISVKIETSSKRLHDLQNHSRISLDHAQDGAETNRRVTVSITETTSTILKITELREEMGRMIAMANSDVEEAKKAMTDAVVTYQEVEVVLSQLDEAITRLRDHVQALRNENSELRDLVTRAKDHANSLEERARLLEEMFRSTKVKADSFLRVIRAYESIVTAIHESMNASMKAMDSAKTALDLTNGLEERARKAKEESIVLKDRSVTVRTRVTEELEPRLVTARNVIIVIRTLNEDSNRTLQWILDQLSRLSPDGYSVEAREVAARAENVLKQAEKVTVTVTTVTDQIQEDQAKIELIQKEIVNANTNIRTAKSSVVALQPLVPEAQGLMERLPELADKVDEASVLVKGNIAALREQIASAHGEATRLKLGMNFSRATELQLKNPAGLNKAGVLTKLSLFFKTVESNGLLSYIGPNQVENRQKDEDFLAVEIRNSFVNLIFNLGGGSVVIENPDVNVSDGKWHQVEVERVGKRGIVTVITDGEEKRVEGKVNGKHTILNLHGGEHTKFFMGGVPSDVRLPGVLQSRSFAGCMEEVTFDGVPVGLWDFVKGKNNGNGCLARDTIPRQVEEYSLDGDGFVSMAFAPGKDVTKDSINLEFRTYAKNGLFVAMGSGSSYLSIQLEDGYVVLHYDLGIGPAMCKAARPSNDGKWHKVNGLRQKARGILVVDGDYTGCKSQGLLSELKTTDTFYVGGLPSTVSFPEIVSKQGFQGCLKRLKLSSQNMPLGKNILSKNLIPGCDNKLRLVSFSEDADESFIQVPNPGSVYRNWEMTMRFKTLESEGLMMYIHDEDQVQYLSLSMLDGKVYLRSSGGRTQFQISTNKTYNDGRWHYLAVNKNGKKFHLYMDETEVVERSTDGTKRINTTSALSLGGFDGPPVAENVVSSARFVGCIKDIIINNKFVNFADSPPEMKKGVLMDTCPLPDRPPIMAKPTILPAEVTTKSAFPVEDSETCALPLIPVTGNLSASGMQFGSSPYSRQEFEDVSGSFRKEAEFQLDFKTTATSGLMFYISDDRHIDFTSVFMKDGQVVYKFDCGSGPGRLVSPRMYNDGKWHQVKLWRNRENGRLIIDGVEVAAGTSKGSSWSISVAQPFYLGGLSKDSAMAAMGNVEDVTYSFPGCLRGLLGNGRPFTEMLSDYETVPCYGNTEVGTFIGAKGGHLILDDAFKVGDTLDISLEIKPRTFSGVLLSVTSRTPEVRDYLVLELVNGTVILSADNGGGKITTDFTFPDKGQICDGKWHTIVAEKNRNVVSLKVDDTGIMTGFGRSAQGRTDTDHPLYIGGIPREEYHKGIVSQGQYVGCLRNLRLNNVQQNLGKAKQYGSVLMNSCPVG